MATGHRKGPWKSAGAPRLLSSQGRNVLILTPCDWFVKECCVQHAPSAPLLLAALLRQRGHHPQVTAYTLQETLTVARKPQAVVFYCPTTSSWS